MIEINLLPGAKKKAKKGGGGSSINFKAMGAAISARVKDKFLAAFVLSIILVALASGYLFVSQQRHEADLKAAEKKALDDSTHYADVLRDRTRAEARRDSALLQLNIIKSIDADRFIWAHVLDEVSRALPPVTWLRTVRFVNPAAGLNPASAFRVPPPDTGKKGKKKPPPPLPTDTVRFQIVGRTVDVQALTRFWRALEDSPFLGAVQLERSEIALEGGREVTQFTLTVTYTPPDSTFLRRTPLTVTQR